MSEGDGWSEPWLVGFGIGGGDALREFCRKCGNPTRREYRERKDFNDHGMREREMRTICPRRRRFNGHHQSPWMGLVWTGRRPAPPPMP